MTILYPFGRYWKGGDALSIPDSLLGADGGGGQW